jgi:hypothetical protein
VYIKEARRSNLENIMDIMESIKTLLEPCELIYDSRWGYMYSQFAEYKEFVYVMECETFIKVGITKNTESRLGTIRACNPYQVDLLLSFAVPLESRAVDIEKAIHTALKKHHHNREWFKSSARALLPRLTKRPDKRAIVTV